MNRLKKLSYHSQYDRDFAFLFVNGECFIADDHGLCLHEYIIKHNINLNGTDEYKILNDKQAAFGHLKGNEVYLMTSMLYNISAKDCAVKIKEINPEYIIYDDDNPQFTHDDKIYYNKLACRLKKNNGLAIDKINSLPGDTVIAYHGTCSAFIDSILNNGLTEMTENSYQNSGINYGSGIWVTLNYDVAAGYAKDSTKGFMDLNKNSSDEDITQYFGYGAIFEFELEKEILTDDGSASNNNLKSTEVISSNKIKNIYVIDIKTNKTWNYDTFINVAKNNKNIRMGKNIDIK